MPTRMTPPNEQRKIRDAVRKHGVRGACRELGEQYGYGTVQKYGKQATVAAVNAGVNRPDVILADAHCPFQDKRVVRAASDFIVDEKPQTIHLLGDITDFYTLSRFDKDARRKEDIQDDLDATCDFLADVRRIAPHAKIIYSEGNHEFRLRKYLRGRAVELANLRALDITKLLRLEEFKIEYKTEPYDRGHLKFLHGNLVRKHGANTARAHFEKYRKCCVVGHAHRAGFYPVTLDGDVMGSYETPCLCSTKVEYVDCPDWQQGWRVVWWHGSRFHMDLVLYIRGAYVYHGKLRA